MPNFAGGADDGNADHSGHDGETRAATPGLRVLDHLFGVLGRYASSEYSGSYLLAPVAS